MKRLFSLLILSSLVVGFIGCGQTNEDLTTEQVSRFLEKKCGYTLLSEVFVHNSSGAVIVGSFDDTKLNFFDGFEYKTVYDVSFSAVVGIENENFVVFLNDDCPEPKILAKSKIESFWVRNIPTPTESKIH